MVEIIIQSAAVSLSIESELLPAFTPRSSLNFNANISFLHVTSSSVAYFAKANIINFPSTTICYDLSRTRL